MIKRIPVFAWTCWGMAAGLGVLGLGAYLEYMDVAYGKPPPPVWLAEPWAFLICVGPIIGAFVISIFGWIDMIMNEREYRRAEHKRKQQDQWTDAEVERIRERWDAIASDGGERG